MAFLTINGIDVPLLNQTPKRSFVRKSRKERSTRGQLRDPARNHRRQWSGTTKQMPLEENEAFANLINGTAHVGDFETGFELSTGLQPLPGKLNCYLDLGNGLGGEDAGFLLMRGATGLSGGDAQIRYDGQFGSKWCVIWHERNGSDWIGAAVTSEGNGWIGGVPNNAAGSGGTDITLLVEGGIATLLASDDVDVDQLVLLPWVPSDLMLSTWTHSNEPLWAPAPALKVEGDIINELCVYVHGTASSLPYMQASVGGSMQNNYTSLKFELLEADDTFMAGLWPDCTIPEPEPELLGGFLLSGYLETPEIVVGNFSDKGPAAPSSPFTISGMPTTEWGYVVNYAPSGDAAWVRTLEGVNGIAAQYDRCFTGRLVHRAGDSAAYFTWYTQAEDVEVRDETGALVTTYNRPANSGPGVLRTFWGGVTSIDISSGAINWTTIADWDVAITTNSTYDLRPMQLAWGGPNNDELVVAYFISTQASVAPVQVPIFGSGTQAAHPAIDYARVGSSRVTSAWMVKVNPSNGDALAADAQVANFNDDIASAGTPNRGFVPGDRFNVFSILWNQHNQLWYMSANHSGYSSLNVDGHIIGRTKTGEIATRGTDNFGGNNSVKPYICTYNSDLEPQNVVTLVCDVLNNGNNRYAYNHSIFLAPDSSGDVFWGWQNMTVSPAVNLQRQGVLGNYGGGAYSVSNAQANDSICVRMDNDLEVVWEASSFDSAASGLGRGHSVQMEPIPNDPTKMLAMISTQGVNAVSNDPTSLFGSANVTFDLRQSFLAAFDIATGAFVDERELERAVSGDKMVAIGVHTVDSGPLQGNTFSSVLMSNDLNTTVQGFYDSAGVRQYTTSDYWVSNGAVHSGSSGGAIHLAAYDADGELDPSLCYPLISLSSGSFGLNQWALWTVPY